MDHNSVVLFTRNGMGHADELLRMTLAVKFLSLVLESGQLPAKLLFYTEGVKLVCAGSGVVDILNSYEQKGVELIICKTCLDYFGLTDQVQVGVVGGMGDIIEAMQMADKVISV